MELKKSPVSWISNSFGVLEKNGKSTFAISGISIEEIAKKIQPPFYIYDAAEITRQYQEFYKALDPHGIKLFYSVKANPTLAIVNGLYSLGAGLEIASLGELLIAEKLQANPKRLSFAGPVKTDEELSRAITYGVEIINAESISEIENINSIAGAKGVIQKIGIRINPLHEVEGAGMTMGGGPKKFGIDVEQVDEKFIKRIISMKHINLVGIHVYAASQISTTEAFVNNMQQICEVAEKLNNIFPIKSINFGGGLGIPYSENQQPLNMNEISKRIGNTLRRFSFITENDTELYFEPGRFFVGTSGIYVAKVNNIKVSRKKKVILLDGGIQHLLRPALPIGFTTHPVCNLNAIDEKNDQLVDVGGSLCTSLDFLGKDVYLPQTKIGDLLGIFCAGAHGMTAAMPFYLSHATSAEILVSNGTFSIIRESIAPDEFFKFQHIPKNSFIRREQ